MAQVEKITELQWYDGDNKITKGLRWVQPQTNLGRHRSILILDKENNLVGSYSGDMPILFDEKFEDKWQGEEIEEHYANKDYLKFVSQEQMLLHICQGLFAFGQSKPGAESLAKLVCLHVQTKFKSLADAACPECSAWVSPSLVMGSLLMAAAELNEHIWEHGAKKDEKEAVVTEDE